MESPITGTGYEHSGAIAQQTIKATLCNSLTPPQLSEQQGVKGKNGAKNSIPTSETESPSTLDEESDMEVISREIQRRNLESRKGSGHKNRKRKRKRTQDRVRESIKRLQYAPQLYDPAEKERQMKRDRKRRLSKCNWQLQKEAPMKQQDNVPTLIVTDPSEETFYLEDPTDYGPPAQDIHYLQPWEEMQLAAHTLMQFRY